jgi:hypothetical protein
MASYNKFNAFLADIGLKKHNLNTDSLKVMLTNTAPVATKAVLADLTEITAHNGYSAGGSAVSGSGWAQTSGVGKLAGTGPTFTASGGTIGPFRYAVLYNATASGGPLIGWWDYGSSVTLNDTETFAVTFADVTDVIQVS